MSKLLINIILTIQIIFTSSVFAKVPEKFIGEWSFEVDKNSKFPWWQQIKYPVKLLVTNVDAYFEDQMGYKCTPTTFFYDDELDSLVFKHCLPIKSNLAFSPFYKIMISDNKLLGEVWTYKLLFNIKGDKAFVN